MVAWGCTWQLLRPGRLGSNHFAPLLQDVCEIFLRLKTSISPSPIFPNEPDHHIAHSSAGTRNIVMSRRGFLRTMGIVNIHVYQVLFFKCVSAFFHWLTLCYGLIYNVDDSHNENVGK